MNETNDDDKNSRNSEVLSGAQKQSVKDMIKLFSNQKRSTYEPKKLENHSFAGAGKVKGIINHWGNNKNEVQLEKETILRPNHVRSITSQWEQKLQKYSDSSNPSSKARSKNNSIYSERQIYSKENSIQMDSRKSSFSNNNEIHYNNLLDQLQYSDGSSQEILEDLEVDDDELQISKRSQQQLKKILNYNQQNFERQKQQVEINPEKKLVSDRIKQFESKSVKSKGSFILNRDKTNRSGEISVDQQTEINFHKTQSILLNDEQSPKNREDQNHSRPDFQTNSTDKVNQNSFQDHSNLIDDLSKKNDSVNQQEVNRDLQSQSSQKEIPLVEASSQINPDANENLTIEKKYNIQKTDKDNSLNQYQDRGDVEKSGRSQATDYQQQQNEQQEAGKQIMIDEKLDQQFIFAETKNLSTDDQIIVSQLCAEANSSNIQFSEVCSQVKQNFKERNCEGNKTMNQHQDQSNEKDQLINSFQCIVSSSNQQQVHQSINQNDNQIEESNQQNELVESSKNISNSEQVVNNQSINQCDNLQSDQQDQQTNTKLMKDDNNQDDQAINQNDNQIELSNQQNEIEESSKNIADSEQLVNNQSINQCDNLQVDQQDQQINTQLIKDDNKQDQLDPCQIINELIQDDCQETQNESVKELLQSNCLTNENEQVKVRECEIKNQTIEQFSEEQKNSRLDSQNVKALIDSEQVDTENNFENFVELKTQLSQQNTNDNHLKSDNLPGKIELKQPQKDNDLSEERKLTKMVIDEEEKIDAAKIPKQNTYENPKDKEEKIKKRIIQNEEEKQITKLEKQNQDPQKPQIPLKETSQEVTQFYDHLIQQKEIKEKQKKAQEHRVEVLESVITILFRSLHIPIPTNTRFRFWCT